MIKPVIGGIVRRIAGVARAVSKARGSARKIGVLRQNFAPAAIVAAVEASLRRLGTDYIDVFFLHEATLDAVRDGELWGALLQLRAEGKLRHLGISSNDTAVLEASLSLPDLSAIETAVNPMRPAALWPLLENFSSLGIGVVANQIFGSGRLLRTDPDEKAAVIRIQLLTRANSLSLSPRAFLLAFALSAPGVASALTGTTNTVHLDENFGDLSAVIARTSLDWATLRDCFQVEH